MQDKILVPPIKSQGIKTKLVRWIKTKMPKEIRGIYFDPFLGSGAVAFNLCPKRAFLSDKNPHLIRFYQAIKDGRITPRKAEIFLAKEGETLSKKGKDHYYFIRERFNSSGNSLDFLFLSRSCFNGLIRFNKSGKYNVPFGHKPERYRKAFITKVSNQIRNVCQVFHENPTWEMACVDFRESLAGLGKDDFAYCDPPYVGRHVDYYGSWSEKDEIDLGAILSGSKAHFILSTWYENKYRKNEFIDRLWSKFGLVKREHFYHVGGKEINRNAMVEALIFN